MQQYEQRLLALAENVDRAISGHENEIARRQREIEQLKAQKAAYDQALQVWRQCQTDAEERPELAVSDVVAAAVAGTPTPDAADGDPDDRGRWSDVPGPDERARFARELLAQATHHRLRAGDIQRAASDHFGVEISRHLMPSTMKSYPDIFEPAVRRGWWKLKDAPA
ncbi:DUF4349 domain-containing protein [Myxococcota bacterium]|nr:DUF4349 domain-containing protein [Myxococcota bacterium]